MERMEDAYYRVSDRSLVLWYGLFAAGIITNIIAGSLLSPVIDLSSIGVQSPTFPTFWHLLGTSIIIGSIGTSLVVGSLVAMYSRGVFTKSSPTHVITPIPATKRVARSASQLQKHFENVRGVISSPKTRERVVASFHKSVQQSLKR